MRISKNRYYICALTSIVVMLTGCGSGNGSSDADPINAIGRISLGISDAPIHDARKVCIQFTEIEFKGEGPSTVITLDPAETINLLDFQGANAYPILTSQELPAGEYQWMRLGVNAVRGGNGGLGDDPASDDCNSDDGSYLVMNGETVHNLYVPSGANSGLKLVGGFTVPVNSNANFTTEFDLGKSLTAPPGLDPDVILRPTIHLVNNTEVGTLTGLVSNDLATAIDAATELACAPSVYVFNDGVVPNAIVEGEDDADDPIATALVNDVTNDAGLTEYRYTVGFLLEGEYEAAFTCNGTDFEPVDGKQASIAENGVTTVDFP